MFDAAVSLSSDQITIAVTAYDRRGFIAQAIESALNQTVPVQVMVVENCGPDADLRGFVMGKFGSRLEYHRNTQPRSMFGNWNACLEYCRTPWLSILHDDDFLAPGFVAAMLALHQELPGRGLYFGHSVIVDKTGRPLPTSLRASPDFKLRIVELHQALYGTPFLFPGQLFQAEAARAAGGFRATSQFCGDWEMWAKLIARKRAAETAETVAFYRRHASATTDQIVCAGRQVPLTYVQHKRVLHLLREAGQPVRFDRIQFQARSPLPTRFLVRHGDKLSPHLLAYHVRLFLLSRPPHWRYGLLQTLTRWLRGAAFIKVLSKAANCLSRT